MRGLRSLLVALVAWLAAAAAWAQFDHAQAVWDALLKQHVHWLPDGRQSRVDYAGFQADRARLAQVLDGFSAVTPAEFGGWTRPQRMAFLINAYNAFTVELILRRFFRLLGEQRDLDWIEHEQLRPNYADPRVHAAVNCASIGCPALRNEAFTAARLEAQLDDGMLRFLGDRTRNRVRGGRLEVSSIFKWFREDFEKGDQGYTRVEDVFAKYAAQLSDDPAEQSRLRSGKLPPHYLDYDWSLNAAGR
jgi:hypothetical protein